MRRSSRNISHNSSTIFQPLGYVTIQCKFIIKERIIPVSVTYIIFSLNNSIPKALKDEKFRVQDGGGINVNHFYTIYSC